ncbi:hypothetical protein [Collimonas humicola]|uniref:hypothetical protein n=1 Tax=Collimonas humicola TaxID=2825886 RepID=UPI001B8D2469|nr:hypothetical protein [Collimonas humicola]
MAIVISGTLLLACSDGGPGLQGAVSSAAALQPQARPSTITPSTTVAAQPAATPATTTPAAARPIAPIPAVTTPVATTPIPPTTTTPAVTASPAAAKPGLYISEVAANYRRTDGVSWMEVFNNSPQAIHLSDYRLRATGWNIATQDISTTPMNFDLPKVDIPAGGYFVIAGKFMPFLTNTDKSAYVSTTVVANGSSKTYLPYWSDTEGFVELLTASDDKTADFVRFGTSAVTPQTTSAWSGANVAAFPAKPDYVTVATPDPLDSYDGSIVRLSSSFTASGSKSDWSRVAFSTPGGPNDVPANAIDSDKDGIPDSAKVQGGTFGGMDLYSLGARKGQRDIFIHVNYMSSATDIAVTPQKNALQMVVDAFSTHNIKIHFDVGNLFSSSVSPASFNLSGDVSHKVAFEKCTQILSSTATSNSDFTPDAGCSSIYKYSSGSFDVRRKPVYRFMQMASSQLASGAGGSSGIAELPGNKFLVTLGGSGFAPNNARLQTILVNFQGGTIMHEFGHTLGLHHGGFEDQNYKPNYFSIMNYMYQLNGLPANASGGNPLQRYYYTFNNDFNSSVPGHATAGSYRLCDLPEGPCNAVFKIDYSNGSGKSLDEANLLEADNIGRGSVNGAYLDWNLNGMQDPASYAYDYINGRTVMRDNDDWSKLVLAANPHQVATAGVEAKAGVRLDELRKRGMIALEQPPSVHLLKELTSLK